MRFKFSARLIKMSPIDDMTSADSGNACRVCGSFLLTSRYFIKHPESRSGVFYLCKSCFSLSFFPNKKSQTYGESYYGLGESRVGGLAQRIRINSANSRAAFIHKHFTPGQCLDIGCGDGEFLKAMSKHGWTVIGTELPGPALQRAQKKFCERIIGTANFESVAEPGSMKLITMWQVFEHLENPRRVFQSCWNLLAADGVLGIGVPNPDSWQARWGGGDWLHFDPPRHLHLQNMQVLIAEAERVGFQCVAHRYPWFEFGPIGWIQTAFNKLGFPRDYFFEQLKNRWSGVSVSARFAWFCVAALSAPIALSMAFLERLAGKPATYEIYLRRSSKPIDSHAPHPR